MQFPFSFWHAGSIDPLSLGQPAIYNTAWPGDPGTLTQVTYNTIAGNPPVSGSYSASGRIATFSRYSDNGLTFTRQVDTSPMTLQKPLGDQIFHRGNGTATNNGLYKGGTNSQFNFMHKQGECAFTVYWIFRNIVGENAAATKMLFTTGGNSVAHGAQIQITGNGSSGTSTRTPELMVSNGSGSFAIRSAQNAYQQGTQIFKLFSWRVQENNGGIAAWAYENGALVSTANQLAALSTVNASSVGCYGNRNANDLRFIGDIGEFIVFQGMHSEQVHAGVVAFLMNKWGIT